jgi:hypothetical protein
MLAIEPILAKFCLHLNFMPKSITQQEFLCLANNIIEGATIETLPKKFQKSICGNTGEKKHGKKFFYKLCEKI